MSRKALFTGIACLLFAGSCSSTPEVQEEKWSLPTQSRPMGEVVLRAQKGSVIQVYSWDDVFCKIYGRDQNSLILETVNRDGTKSRPVVRYGRGKNELMLTAASRGRNSVLLHDLMQERVIEVDVAKALEDETYEPQMRVSNVFSQEVIPFEGRKMLYLNRYSWEDGQPRFYLTGRDGNEKRHRKGDKDGFSVVNGELICHQEKGRVVFVDRFNPEMEIWSLNGTLLRKIGIDEVREAHFKEVEIGGVKDFYWINEVPSCFASGNGNASKLALAYHNAAGESCIFIMDWEGQMLQSFQVPGKVLEISISSSGDSVDCWTAFPEEDCLVRYPL